MRRLIVASLSAFMIAGLAHATPAVTEGVLTSKKAALIDRMVVGVTITEAHKRNWQAMRQRAQLCSDCFLDQPFPDDLQKGNPSKVSESQ